MEELKSFGECYDYLIENNLFQEETLNILTCVNGASIDTLNQAIYAKYGYRTLQDLINE